VESVHAAAVGRRSGRLDGSSPTAEPTGVGYSSENNKHGQRTELHIVKKELNFVDEKRNLVEVSSSIVERGLGLWEVRIVKAIGIPFRGFFTDLLQGQ
jgi:hypothetical protein